MTFKIHNIFCSSSDSEFPATHEEILLCDDDVADRKLMAEIVSDIGFQASEVSTLEDAQVLFSTRHWVLVVLHSSSSPRDTLSLCQWIRGQSTTPILVLTSRSEDVDEQMALASGADDYIVKPLDPKILLCRLEQQLSRALSHLNTLVSEFLEAGVLSLDLHSHRVSVGDHEVGVTKTEFAILEELIRHQDAVVSRAQLCHVLNLEGGTSPEHVIDTHMSRLRHKLAENGLAGAIDTVHGVGFRLSLA